MVFRDTQTAATAAAVITAPLQTVPVVLVLAPGKYFNNKTTSFILKSFVLSSITYENRSQPFIYIIIPSFSKHYPFFFSRTLFFFFVLYFFCSTSCTDILSSNGDPWQAMTSFSMCDGVDAADTSMCSETDMDGVYGYTNCCNCGGGDNSASSDSPSPSTR